MIINPVIGGVQLPELVSPAGSGQILDGYQAINQEGEIITGNILNASIPKPSISISDSGLITASSNYSTGYINAGSISSNYQLNTTEGKTITPSTSDQTAIRAGRYATGNIYVDGDSNLSSSYIVKGTSIFGVEGEAVSVDNIYECGPNDMRIYDNNTVSVTRYGLSGNYYYITISFAPQSSYSGTMASLHRLCFQIANSSNGSTSRIIDIFLGRARFGTIPLDGNTALYNDYDYNLIAKTYYTASSGSYFGASSIDRLWPFYISENNGVLTFRSDKLMYTDNQPTSLSNVKIYIISILGEWEYS